MAFHDFFSHKQSVCYTAMGLACLGSALACYIVHTKAVFLSISHLLSFIFFIFLAPMAFFFLATGIHSYIREALCDLQLCRRAQAEAQQQQQHYEYQPQAREGKLSKNGGVPHIAEVAEDAEMTDIALDTAIPTKGMAPQLPPVTYKKVMPATIVPESVLKGKICIGLFLDSLVALACFAFCIVLWTTHLVEVMRCGFLFCVGEKYLSGTAGARQQGSLRSHAVLLGFLFLPAGAGFTAHMIRQAVVFRRILTTSEASAGGVREGKDGESSNRATTFHDLYKPYKAISDRKKFLQMGIAIFLLIVCAVGSFYVPNDFHRMSASKIATYIAGRVSPDYNRGTNLMVPEFQTAFFHTTSYRVTEYVYLKFFPSNLFFYCYLMLLVVLGYVLRWTRTGRSWFHRRLHAYSSWTLGECVLTFLTAVMTALFSMYWIHDHNFKTSWNSKTNTTAMKWGERWGRAIGQIAVLFLSLLLFPISHSSLLHDCLGTTWESFLRFHRLCGYAMLLATALHTAFFYVSFHQHGKLKYNFVHYPSIVSYKGINNDYTMVPISILTYLMFISMGIFSFHKLRRRFYDLFYYTHVIVAVMMIPLTILHAAAAWMYLLPGMTLWMADMFVRMWQRAAQVELVSARLVGDDVVEVRFRYPRAAMRPTIYAGQYVYVNFPQLSVLEWHPITLAPPPPTPENEDARDVYAMYIKSMGTGTWTESLRDKVMKGGELTSIAIDGPYGHGVDMSDFEEVYMFAGGIGITPCATLFTSLLHTAQEGKPHPHYVHLTWSCRSAALVGALSEAMMLPSALCTLNHAAADPVPASSISRSSSNDSVDVLMTEADLSAGGNTVPVPSKAMEPCDGEVEGVAAGSPVEEDGTPHGFECHVYLTKPEDYATVQQAMSAATEPADEMLVKTLVHEGRPCVPTQLVPYLTAANNAATVRKKRPHRLFFACGPEKMINEVCKAAANIGAEVHIEVFKF